MITAGVANEMSSNFYKNHKDFNDILDYIDKQISESCAIGLNKLSINLYDLLQESYPILLPNLDEVMDNIKLALEFWNYKVTPSTLHLIIRW